jgi:hypothetical protein
VSIYHFSVERWQKFKLFWFFVWAMRVGKNQMCLNVRWLSLHGTQRFAAKRSGGLDALNCLNAQCLLIAQLFIYALPPPFFLGAVMGWFYLFSTFFGSNSIS